jgi:cold shock CspA family protein
MSLSQENNQQEQSTKTSFLTNRIDLPEGQERFMGVVKTFKGTYGFAIILGDCEHSGEDIMINHANIMTSKECYKTLQRGEHIEFGIETLDDGRIQAINVTGPEGYVLMCETNPHIGRRYRYQINTRGRGRGNVHGRGRGRSNYNYKSKTQLNDVIED